MLSLYFCRTVRVDCPVFIWRYTMKEEKIKVLALLPMELPKEIELDNTLEAMQKFVGGLIEWQLSFFVILCAICAISHRFILIYCNSTF